MGCIHYNWLPVGSKFKNHLNLWLKMICRECSMQAAWERASRWLGWGPVSMGSLLWYQKVLTLLKPIRGRSVGWIRVFMIYSFELLIWLENRSCEFDNFMNFTYTIFDLVKLYQVVLLAKQNKNLKTTCVDVLLLKLDLIKLQEKFMTKTRSLISLFGLRIEGMKKVPNLYEVFFSHEFFLDPSIHQN